MIECYVDVMFFFKKDGESGGLCKSLGGSNEHAWMHTLNPMPTCRINGCCSHNTTLWHKVSSNGSCADGNMNALRGKHVQKGRNRRAASRFCPVHQLNKVRGGEQGRKDVRQQAA